MAIGMATLAAALLLQAAPAAELHWVRIAATDEKGAPLRDLVPEEVAVLENGVARDVARVEADTRPLSAVILVDTSQAVGSAYRLNVVEAVVSFVQKLPEASRYALWTTGDRPTRVVEFTDDRGAAGQALRRVAPQGGNTLLDALVEATRDLKEEEGRRSAVVVVGGMGVEFSSYERHQVVDRASRCGATFMGVLFEEGPVTFEDRQSYEFVLGRLAEQTGGVFETALSAMGVGSALAKLGADLSAQYRVAYATLAGIKSPKLEIKIARPGVRVRVGAGERRP